MTRLQDKLIAQIKETGPMSVAQFMAAALYDPAHGYYSRRPRIGEDGDFVTAPEISQMFGELVGAWCVHEWEALGRPDPFWLIELGPGRGTLMSDIVRAAKIAPAFRNAARVHFVEVSAVLRAAQEEAIAPFGVEAHWAERFEDIAPGPSLIVANEFFDCLPIRQFVRDGGGWRERLIGIEDGDLAYGLSGEALGAPDFIPPQLAAAREGAIAEIAPALPAWVSLLSERLHEHPGRALVIDYGGDGEGDTLQAMALHQRIGALDAPGDSDLTAHVDFDAFARHARAAGLAVAGPIGQGDFLRTLGIDARAAALSLAHPESAAPIARGLQRLTHGDEMGALFQALCLSSPLLPAPAGF